MNMEEGPAAGAAIMAAVGSGHFSSIEEACDRMLTIETVSEPIPEHVEQYNDYYQTYRALYHSLKDDFQRQSQIVQKYMK